MQNSSNFKILFHNNSLNSKLFNEKNYCKNYFSTFLLIIFCFSLICFSLICFSLNINNPLFAENNNSNRLNNLNNKFKENAQIKNNVLIKNSNLDNIDLSFFPEFIGIDSININSELYLKPNINDCYSISEAGSPAELIKTILITVPDSNSFYIDKYYVSKIRRVEGKLIPVETTTFDRNNDYTKSEYIVNQELYNSFEQNNRSWVKVEYYGIIGNRHIAKIEITVAKYNFNKNHNYNYIEILEQIDLTVKFNNSDNGINNLDDSNDNSDNLNNNNNNLGNDNSNYNYNFGYSQNIKDEIELTINHNETKNWLIRNNNYLYNNYNYANYAKSKYGNQFQSESIKDLDEISDGEWLRLTISNEGIYRITAAELAAKGINIPKDKVNTIKIFGQSGQPMNEAVKNPNELNLNEQEIIVKTNADGSLSSIIFYASAASGFYYDNSIKRPRHYLNYMDTKNYYLLTFGKTEGKRSTGSNVPDGEVKYRPELYTASLFFHEDLYMPAQPGFGVLWLGNTLTNLVKENLLSNFARKGDVEYVISVAHTAPNAGNITVTVNNNITKNFSLNACSGTTSAIIQTGYFKMPATSIPANNRNTLKFAYNGTPIYPYLNFYEIHYKSELVPIDNEIVFYSNIVDFDAVNKSGIAEYNIKNFTGEIFGFDVTNMSNPVFISNISTTNGIFSFKANEKYENVKKYFISSKMYIPQIEKIDMLNLRSIKNKYSNADIILITANEFIESANKYAEYRTKQSNVKVSVVPIQKIYNEFSFGRLDLVAIKDYIQYCNTYWENPPSYVILWGTGHYDYRGIYEPKPNFIPAYQTPIPITRAVPVPANEGFDTFNITEGTNTFSTDDFYVRIVNDYPYIPIGRVPISNNKEGEYYIEKLNNFENKSSTDLWRKNVTILADDGATSRGSSDTQKHTQAGESFASKVPKDFNVEKIYLIAYPVVYLTGGARRIPKVNEEILNKCNINGTSLFLYTGHGNPNTLTHERVFPREMISQFTNTDKLYFFGAGSCEVGRFDQSNGCMGSDIVTQRNTAAIASFTATRVSGIQSNIDLFVNLTENFFKRKNNNEYYTTGQVCNMTKIGYYNNEGKMYVLLGDPTIKLHFPELSIAIDEINDTKMNMNKQAISVPALSYLKLKGRIISNSDSILQSDFNGTVSIVLNEADIRKEVIESYNGLNFVHSFTVNGATLNKSSYVVENGIFTAEFVIPGDISFNDSNAHLYLYAVSNDNRYAKGYSNKLVINSIGSLDNDNEGPIIDIKLDSRDFIAGDIVSKNPLLIVDLWDETGINTTGLGIGHKIEAWIDDNTPIDITNDFVSSLTDSRGGTILKHLYGIPAGKHKVKISAWDVFNNLSTAETHFLIPEDDEEGILEVKMIPNPGTINNTSQILIKYNVTPPINATITIVDALGSKVTTFPFLITTTNSTLIDWDNTDSDGIPVNTGTYYYRINFEFGNASAGYRSCEKFGVLGIINK